MLAIRARRGRLAGGGSCVRRAGCMAFFFARDEAMAGSRKGEGRMEASAAAGPFALAQLWRCLITSKAAHIRHLTLVVKDYLGGDRSPIGGDSDHVAAPARPPTHLGASKPPAAKLEDLPRGWARDSARWV